MKVLTNSSFMTESGATVSAIKHPSPRVQVRFNNLAARPVAHGDMDYVLDFTEEESKAMQTLMNGDFLETVPTFGAGDLVRAHKSAGVTQPGALAIVQDPPHKGIWGPEAVNVKWIDTRANSVMVEGVRQKDGEYSAKNFEFVEPSELTDEDYRCIGKHQLDTLRTV